MSFVIFDTEYTTWPGCQENGWHGKQKRELVQLAALKVSSNLRVIQKLNVYCQPKINPILSDYFISLAGYDNDFIRKNGVLFSECYQKFSNFVDNDLCLSFGWGKDFTDPSDGRIMDENLKLNHLSPEHHIQYRNIAGWFRDVFAQHNIHIDTINSGKIAKTLGVGNKLTALGLNEHNAFYDVYSILTGMRYFRDDWDSFVKSERSVARLYEDGQSIITKRLFKYF